MSGSKDDGSGDSTTISLEKLRRQRRRWNQPRPQPALRPPPEPPLQAPLQPPPLSLPQSSLRSPTRSSGSTSTSPKAASAAASSKVAAPPTTDSCMPASTDAGPLRPARPPRIRAESLGVAGSSPNAPCGTIISLSRSIAPMLTGGSSGGTHLSTISNMKAASDASGILVRSLATVGAAVPSIVSPHGIAAGSTRAARPSNPPPRRAEPAARSSRHSLPSGTLVGSPTGLSKIRHPKSRSGGTSPSTGPSQAADTTRNRSGGGRRDAGPSSAAGSSTSSPPGRELIAGPPTAAGPLTGSRLRSPVIRLGMESEFLLAARHPAQRRDYCEEFVRELAFKYNTEVAFHHPRMHRELRRPVEPDDYTKWTMVYEDSIMTSREPWGMEMRTPALEFKPGWRDCIHTTWKYLEEHYHIIPTHDCGTHIHISLTPQYTLDQLKRIASAIIYFEPAFEALVPDDRRGNEWCRSIWLEGPKFAWQDKTRAQSIELIERAPNTMALLSLLHLNEDPRYAWNFWSLLSPKQTIEFRQPPSCETADEALSWAELAVNFIQVSVKHGSAASLRLYPANAKGLRWYLGLVHERGVSEPDRLRRIWAGIQSPNAAIEPIYVPWGGDELRPGLEAKAAEDMRLIRRHPQFN